MRDVDVVVVGASFAGLSCAQQLAEDALEVVVLERKKEAGQAVRTTGIIVKEAVEDLALPEEMTKPVERVRLYAPSLSFVDLQADDYFFLATDTPNIMRYIASRAEITGAELVFDAPFVSAQESADGKYIHLPDYDLRCRFLVGADGPRSAVAAHFNLGCNRKFLLGAEAEFSTAHIEDHNAFHCFLNQKLAFGYLGWVVPGVSSVQVGLATCLPHRPDIDAMIAHVAPLFGLERKAIVARRGGLIPVGGRVSPMGRGRVMLLGDAAGTVSPLSGGGIHTADYYGRRLGTLIGAYLQGEAQHPAIIEKEYPSFYAKHVQRWTFEHLVPDWLLNGLLATPLLRVIAKLTFFRQKRLPPERRRRGEKPV